MTRRDVKLILGPAAVVALAFLTSCNVEKVLDGVFKDLRLVRLRILRDDVAPADIVLSGGGRSVLRGNLKEFIPNLSLKSGDGSTDFNAIMAEKIKTSKSKFVASADLAKLVKSLTGASAGADLTFTNSATLKQLNASGRKASVTEIEATFPRQEASEFRKFVERQLGQKNRIFIVFETYRTSTIDLSGENGRELKANGTFGTGGAVKLNFENNASDKSNLKVSGDKQYVFAVRVGEIKKDAQGSLFVNDTKFELPGGLGADDVKYSTLIDTAPSTQLLRIDQLPQAQRKRFE